MRQTHGLSKTPEYRIWAGIVQRCTNRKRKDFEAYGGVGIVLCREWRHDFQAFYDYVGPRPTPTHSIDRIDNAKGYEPGNVRWATLEQQAQNTSMARPITYSGKTRTVSEWARETGIGFTTLIARLNRGYALEDVFSSSPVGHLNQRPKTVLTHNGRTGTVKDWADWLGLEKRTIAKRLRRGIPLERALTNPMPPP